MSVNLVANLGAKLRVEKAEGMESLTVIKTGIRRRASIDAVTQRGCLAGEADRASVSSDFSTLGSALGLVDRFTLAGRGARHAT